ncbi:MAG: class I SAM-dependent methyltransferase [Candidatus Margulisbacteria bacterium]|nr:class I SAM-dependent methyltransferase [Candidatus Margulisiibacteriota bacterium]
MVIQKTCFLCSSQSPLFIEDRNTNFYKCSNCRSVFRDPDDNISPEQEKQRYQAHNNDPASGYRSFVAPIINAVTSNFTPSHLGLDFGAGPVPVIAEILKNKDYKIEIYDPFFHDRPEFLNQTYDYITACEVIEHFRDPAREFKLLRSLLKPNGALLCMTELLEPAIDFQKWPYKNDVTHRFFYTRKALEWIRDNLGFASLKIEGRLASFIVSSKL